VNELSSLTFTRLSAFRHRPGSEVVVETIDSALNLTVVLLPASAMSPNGACTWCRRPETRRSLCCRKRSDARGIAGTGAWGSAGAPPHGTTVRTICHDPQDKVMALDRQ